MDKEAENGQAIGAPGGSAEVPIEFLVEVDELHLRGKHKSGVPWKKGRAGWAMGATWGSKSG